ncbi:hypothetical protein [Paracoccus seriniphilus]|uniref:hypothetical protein n=1 Tax=Paracoccus seriniphilus TaxID=184748 RepID=UPI003561344E
MKRFFTAIALIPSAAAAHVGDHSHVAATHLLTEPDHLGVIGVVIVIALGAWLWRRGRS